MAATIKTVSKTNVSKKRDGFWTCPSCGNLNRLDHNVCTGVRTALVITPKGRQWSKVLEHTSCRQERE